MYPFIGSHTTRVKIMYQNHSVHFKVRADPCRDAIKLTADANLGVVVAAYGVTDWLPPKDARVNKPTGKHEHDSFSF